MAFFTVFQTFKVIFQLSLKYHLRSIIYFSQCNCICKQRANIDLFNKSKKQITSRLMGRKNGLFPKDNIILTMLIQLSTSIFLIQHRDIKQFSKPSPRSDSQKPKRPVFFCNWTLYEVKCYTHTHHFIWKHICTYFQTHKFAAEYQMNRSVEYPCRII